MSVTLFIILSFFYFQNLFGDMSLVEEGFFYMGQTKTIEDESPIHRVHISSFYIKKFEVTIREWQEVTAWAVHSGYDFSSAHKSSDCMKCFAGCKNAVVRKSAPASLAWVTGLCGSTHITE